MTTDSGAKRAAKADKLVKALDDFNALTASLRAVIDEDFESTVLGNRGVVVVQFFARWCGPCHRAGSVLDGVTKRVADVLICKLDVEAAPVTAKRFAVRRYPTIILFKKGTIREIYRGERTVEAMMDWLASYLEPAATKSDS